MDWFLDVALCLLCLGYSALCLSYIRLSRRLRDLEYDINGFLNWYYLDHDEPCER